MPRRHWSAALTLAMLAASAASAHGAPRVRRLCGWWQNPTPQNAWLVDRSGEWTVSIQGGHEASGDWPEFPDRQWVQVNGPHGYGCACIVAAVDAGSRRVLAIRSARARPLRACRRDRSLPPPG